MYIFDIKRGSVHDGPGIRSVIFFKGCPLRCHWCHNPESYIQAPQLAYRFEKCAGCGKCRIICPNNCHTFSDAEHIFDRRKCISCGKCADECRFNALELFGRKTDIEKVISEISKDLTYYKASGGGITLSGGEPLFQPKAAISLSKAAHNIGISVCIETSGYGKKEDFLKISEFTDLFLFDIKLKPELYFKYTNKNSDIIFENLYALDKINAKIIFRCPIIPNINMNKEHFKFISDLAKSLKNVQEIHLEPYHPIGLAKAASLEIKSDYTNHDFLDKKNLIEFSEYLKTQTNLPAKIL